nr:MAG: RNA-dependent RNA polymerase [Phenuiviridae sp.]
MTEIRQDSLFSVREIIEDIVQPQFYSPTDVMEPKYKVNYQGSLCVEFLGLSKWYQSSDEELRKIRHEIVASATLDCSDEPLTKIGVTDPRKSGRTPDFINTEKRIVCEVATVAGNDRSSLETAFKGKMYRYKEVVESCSYDLAVVVVGRYLVYSNLPLSQSVVNCLIHRFRIGNGIESAVSNVMGEDIFSNDWSEMENKCKDIFDEFTTFPVSTDLFDTQTILSAANKPTRSDYQTAGIALRDALRDSTKASPESSASLQKYLESFDDNSRTDMKRVTNIPMIVCEFKDNNTFLDPESADMPSWLKNIWCTGREYTAERLDLESQIAVAMKKQKIDVEKHFVQKQSAFNVDLDPNDTLEAAKTGLWAKSLKDHPDIVEKDMKSHLSFHPTNTDTEDISEFMKMNLCNKRMKTSCINKSILDLIRDAKNIYNPQSTSLLLLELLTMSEFSHFAQGITELFTEICYTYKYWIKRSDFYHKVHKGVHMLIRCTGDHVFVSYAFPKWCSSKLETGRIGPKIFESDNYYFTDFSSYNEPTVEHFVKAGPYLTSILFHLLSHYELPLHEIDYVPDYVSETANGILAIYLNNKTDLEELITNQRYLTMGVLEELDPNPYRFVDRLPDVLRSRMTSFFLKRTIHHMITYDSAKIIKSKVGLEEDETIEFTGLKSIFCDKTISLKQKINEFYFGYVISKERGRGSDRNFKIMKKIVAEEYRFRDTVTKTFSDSLDPKMHVSNPILIRVFMEMFRGILESQLGKEWQSIITKAILHNCAKQSFYDLSTMKVASRTYNEKIVVPSTNADDTTFMLRQKLEAANPNETKRRPRVMEAIKRLIDQFKEEGNPSPEHPIELLPYCLNRLESKGYFDSDIFPKPQHGGDREIHVLEIMARIVQLFQECISRTLCEFIPSDTLTHPETKERFVKNHYKQANSEHKGQFLTMGKSADATKWCQRHHSSKFAMMLVGATEFKFWSFILRTMNLWQKKRITFPIQFAANFMANKDTKSNKIYERMRGNFFEGKEIFDTAYNNKMWIQSGMMQGILHYTSSFCHGVIQEVMKKIQKDYLSKKGLVSTITIVQGSDDSAELISMSGRKNSLLARISTTMLHWKENISKFFCIYTSRAKSSIGTIDLIEYNSEWTIRDTTIKPTFRWVSSCMETGIVEKFVDRYQNMYGTCTTVLEGGGKVLEVALIQLCQAWMHYTLLGFHNSDLSELASFHLQMIKDPSLGYFMVDSDYTAGIPGYNFLLYTLYKRTNYGHGLGRSVMDQVEIDFFQDDNRDPGVSKDLRRVRLRFGDNKIFQRILRDMDVPELEELIKEVDKDPSLLYFPTTEWESSKFRIFLKVFEPGVKESLSRHAANARMMAASAYMLSRPCLLHPSEKTKSSLLYLISKEVYDKDASRYKPKLPSRDVFLHHESYRSLLSYIEQLETGAIIKPQQLKARSKQKIMVFETEDLGINLIDMCKRKWFNRGANYLSEKQFQVEWEETKRKYPFISDTRVKTKADLRMTDLQLKNFLETQSEKKRSITLLDTAAKSSSVSASLTRIYWTNTKLLLPHSLGEDETVHSLRSQLFSIVTCWLPNAEIRRMVSDVLSKSEMLKLESIPNRVAKLRCLKDFIIGGSRELVLKRITKEKLGSVGFFTVRQQGWGENRRGFGEWKGTVLDSEVRIEMDGNTCKLIEINKLSRHKELGSLLINMIRGFSLKMPVAKSASTHWLTESGRIVWGKGKKASIPIEVNAHLRVKIVDLMLDYNWTWDIVENRIRIVAHVDQDNKITILSEQLTSADWDPHHGLQGSSEVALWSRGERIELDTFTHEFSKLMSKRPRDILKDIRQQYNLKTLNGWSVVRLMDTLKYFYCRYDKDPEVNSDDLDTSSVSDLDSLLDFIMENSDDQIDIDFAEEEERELDQDLFELLPEDIAEVDAQLDILLQQTNPTLNMKLDKSKMPVSNQSLANLNLMCRAQLNMSLGEAVAAFRENESLTTYGVIGFILTMLTKRYCLRQRVDESEKLAQDWESASISQLSSIRSEADIDGLDEEELIESIEYLESQIKTAPPRMKERFRHSLARMKASLRTVRLSAPSTTELDNMESSQLFDKLRAIVSRPLREQGISVSRSNKLFYTQLRNYLDRSLDDKVATALITPHEHVVYRESVSKTFVTPMLVDTLSMTFSLNITVKDYSSEFGVDSDMITIT